MLLEGGWTEGVTSALLHMGCALLDTAAMSPPAHTPTAVSPGSAAAASAASAASGQLPGDAAADGDAAMWPGGAAAGFVFSGVVPSCLAGVVQPPTLDGVLGAIAAAATAAAGSGEAAAAGVAVGSRAQTAGARQGDSRGAAGSGGEGSDGGGGWVAGWASGGWQRRLRSLGAAERRQLRAFLLQSKWFPGAAWNEEQPVAFKGTLTTQ